MILYDTVPTRARAIITATHTTTVQMSFSKLIDTQHRPFD